MTGDITFHTAIRKDPVWVRCTGAWLTGTITGFSPKHARVLLDGRRPAKIVKVLWEGIRRRKPELKGADSSDVDEGDSDRKTVQAIS